MFRNKIIALLLIIWSFWSGCIREDNSECPEGLYILFIPENTKHIFPEIVHTVDLLFYDMNGNLGAMHHYKSEQLRNGDKAAYIEYIPEGTYQVVAIINNITDYCTNNTDQLSDLRTYLLGTVIQHRVIDFFSGMKIITVTRDNNIQEEIMPIFKHNNHIRLLISMEGFHPQDDFQLQCYIAGNNGMYHYQSHSCNENEYRTYLPYDIKTNQTSLPDWFDFSTMRLWIGSDITLYIHKKELTRASVQSLELNIAEKLSTIRNEDGEYIYNTDDKLQYNDEYEIVLKLDSDFFILELTINGWSIIGGNVDI